MSQQAPPAITPGAIVNAASLMPASLAAGGVPRGGLVALFGPRLELDRVSIKAQGHEYALQPQFRSETNVTAYVPVDVSAGDATLAVTYRGQRSVDHPVQVVDYSPGLFAVRAESFSCEQARAFLDRRNAIPRPAPLAPGASAVLWATGVSVAAELTVAGERVAMQPLPPCLPGLQRFAFKVPTKPPRACSLPVVVTAPNSPTSNFLPLPVSPCVPPDSWFVKAAANPEPLGFVLLLRSALRLEGKGKTARDTFYDSILATFGVRLGPPDHPDFIWPPAGQCVSFSANTLLGALVNDESLDNASRLEVDDFVFTVPRGPKLNLEYPQVAVRDAGPSIWLNGREIPKNAKHQRYYFATLGGNPPVKTIKPSPRFWKPGPYRIESRGGMDIGSFSINGRFPQEPVWTNRDRIDAVDRRKGVTLEWKAPRGYSSVFILALGIDTGDGASTLCLCVPFAGATSFTVPPAVLANVPATLIPGSYYYQLAIVSVPDAMPPSAAAKGVGEIYAVPLSVVSKSVAFLP
ncbi:MAG: hypothetical protein IT168_28090 [Bryobacterales bacterium]|nr:hypothetical protein [Bryobacterales bacterium]